MAYQAVIGASGTLGEAFISALLAAHPDNQLMVFSRGPISHRDTRVTHIPITYDSESAIESAIGSIASDIRFDRIIVATGLLHNGRVKPEKSLRELHYDTMQEVFMANTYFPAMIAKYFLPRLATDRRAVMAFLSARVGSISDNHLGGWYAYRASKAALNMIVKNAAIEFGRFHKQAIIVGLHPGTVQSPLSEPYSAHVAPEKVFTPSYSVEKMMTVIDSLQPSQSGNCYAWDGSIVPA
jgi:NAD(P)-dependent dehydrogenase (short-subunit alcohol dehydrogenase family)